METLLTLKGANVLELICLLIVFVSGCIYAKKGFVRCMFGIISTVLALILAFVFAKILAGYMDVVKEVFSGQIEGWLLKRNGFNMDVSGEGFAAAIENVNLPAFIKNAIAKSVSEINDLPEGTTLASLTAPVLSQYAILLCAWLAIFLVSKIVLALIGKIMTKLVESVSLFAALNHLLGFCVGVVKILIFVCCILAVLSLFANEKMTVFFDGTFVLKYLYHYNPINRLLGKFIR